jgi:excisionase family DNA binding protein
MARRTVDLDAPFLTIRNAARLTGLSMGYIRDGCKNGTIPHLKTGNEYKINIKLFLRQLDGESLENLRKEVNL